MLLTLPFISEDFLFFLFVFARVFGLLFISPLLADKSITTTVRIFISLFTTIMISIVLYPEYHKNAEQMKVYDANNTFYQELVLTSLIVLKEAAIGYLIGFCFNLIFEAMILAGELIDNMIGFTTAQFVDPISNTVQSLLAKLLTFTAFIVMLALDLHFAFFYVIVQSFNIIPLGSYATPHVSLEYFTLATSSIFTYGLKIATIPFITLNLSIIGIGFISRALPEFNPLITGIIIRILIGLFSIIVTLKFIPVIMENFFVNIQRMIPFIVQAG